MYVTSVMLIRMNVDHGMGTSAGAACSVRKLTRFLMIVQNCMVSNMGKHYIPKNVTVIDHFNDVSITRPDPHSTRKYDFDFHKIGDDYWRYLNSSNDLSAFDKQIKVSLESGAEYRILISETGEIVKTNVV